MSFLDYFNCCKRKSKPTPSSIPTRDPRSPRQQHTVSPIVYAIDKAGEPVRFDLSISVAPDSTLEPEGSWVVENLKEEVKDKKLKSYT